MKWLGWIPSPPATYLTFNSKTIQKMYVFWVGFEPFSNEFSNYTRGVGDGTPVLIRHVSWCIIWWLSKLSILYVKISTILMIISNCNSGWWRPPAHPSDLFSWPSIKCIIYKRGCLPFSKKSLNCVRRSENDP